MANQGSIWLQMVIIAAAAILLPFQTTKAVYFTSLCQNSPAHLTIDTCVDGEMNRCPSEVCF